MSVLKISEIEKYWVEHWTENFSSKTNKIIKENKLYVDKVCLSKIKPTLEYMLDILEKNDPLLLKFYKDAYENNKGTKDYKFESLDEYVSSKYWQIWSSESIDKKAKVEEGEYYYRPEYLTDKWKVIECDFYRKNWDIYEYCRDKKITDFKFEWWWFNLH